MDTVTVWTSSFTEQEEEAKEGYQLKKSTKGHHSKNSIMPI